MKKLLVRHCKECRHYYSSVGDPYLAVGWPVNKCTRENREIYAGEENTIPIWCPLPDA